VTNNKQQGGKGDDKATLDDMKLLIDEGKTEEDLQNYSFRLWCQNRMSLSAYIAEKSGARDWKTTVVVLWGDTGIGKSRWCKDNYPNAYWKPKSKWWDGYKGQDVVIVDDFYGWLPIDDLLRLCDRYPKLEERKGSVCQFLAKTLIFTSNSCWENWYKAWNDKHIAAMRRRIDYEFHGEMRCYTMEDEGGGQWEEAHWEQYDNNGKTWKKIQTPQLRDIAQNVVAETSAEARVRESREETARRLAEGTL